MKVPGKIFGVIRICALLSLLDGLVGPVSYCRCMVSW